MPIDPKPQTIPKFGCDQDGRIVNVFTKRYGWRPIRAVNAYYLQNVLDLIEQAGKKFNKPWYALDQELKRRQSTGEIKPRSQNESVENPYLAFTPFYTEMV
jgi:hypothetical protein